MSDKGAINSIDTHSHKTLSGKDTKFGHLTVIVNTIDLFNLFKQTKSSDFTVNVNGKQQSPDTFPGSESGTKVKVGVGGYQVTEDLPEKISDIGKGDANVLFSQDCSGIMHNNEDKTCKITNTIQ
jgi:hypothetical protein